MPPAFDLPFFIKAVDGKIEHRIEQVADGDGDFRHIAVGKQVKAGGQIVENHPDTADDKGERRRIHRDAQFGMDTGKGEEKGIIPWRRERE